MHQNHWNSKTLVCSDDLPHKKWYKHLSYLFRFRLYKGSECMLVSMCYLHWQTKKTVLDVSLERNKTDSKGETHLKSHPALWFHLWVKQPLPVCLFCCVSPSKHCHESVTPFCSSSRFFPSLPPFFFLSSPSSAFGSPRRSPPFRLPRTCCGRVDDTKGRTRASFPDKRVQPGVQQRKTTSLFP